MPNKDADSTLKPWWGTFTIEEGMGGRWDVGPSTVWLYRTAIEWRVFHRPSHHDGHPDSMADRSEVVIPVAESDLPSIAAIDDETYTISRHSFRTTTPRVSVMPVHADRPIITRPEYPLYIPAGESVTLYISTPLWIRIELPEPKRLVREIASFRMSDTWFGPSTLKGEICYATRTTGRFRRENLPLRYHRAITPVRVRNKAKDALSLERLQLPARHLSIFRAPDDSLWTEEVTMTRSEGTSGADIDIKSGPPADVPGSTRIQEARDPIRKGLFTSTFGTVTSLFSS